MSKRTSYYRRTSHEIKSDTRKGYSNLIKYPGKIHPAFLQKPYSACEKKVKEETSGIKNQQYNN